MVSVFIYFRFRVLGLLVLLNCVVKISAQCAFHNYLETTQVSSTQLTISLRCYDRYGDDEFQVTYQLMNRGQCDARNGRTDSPFDSRTTMWATGSFTDANNSSYQHSATLYNLLPYSTYHVSVQARQPYAGGFRSGSIEEIYPDPRTSETAPRDNVMVTDISESSLTFTWMQPMCGEGTGVITKYSYVFTDNYSATSIMANTSDTSIKFTDLTPYVTYNFRVAAWSSAGQGPYSDAVTGQTLEDIPGIPVNLTALDIEETSVRLQWKSPMKSNGVILDYPIKYKAIKKTYDSSFVPSDEAYVSPSAILNLDGSIHGYTVGKLSPSTKYEFVVAGRTSAGSGGYARIVLFTKAFTGLKQPNFPAVKIVNGVGIIAFNDLPEFVSNVYITVENGNGRRKIHRRNNPLHVFIVANLTRKEIDETMTFTVGDNKTYGGYVNHALIGGQSYGSKVGYASCTPEECLEVWSSLSIFTAPSGTFKQLGRIIKGGVVAVIVVGVVLIGLICNYRKNKAAKQQLQPLQKDMEETGHDVNIAMQTKISSRAQSDLGLFGYM